MCIRKKPKKICDLCLFKETCIVQLPNDTYCDQFVHRTSTARILCHDCRHRQTCRFSHYMKCLQCQFYRRN